MSTDVLEPVGLNFTHEQLQALKRIKTAQWQPFYSGVHAWALIAKDDSEALIVLTPRFNGGSGIPEKTLYVVDATDKCYLGLDAAMKASFRDLRVEMGLPA